MQKRQPHTITFPVGLHKRLTRLAHQEERSFNKQVVFMLELATTELERKIAQREREETRDDGR